MQSQPLWQHLKALVDLDNKLRAVTAQIDEVSHQITLLDKTIATTTQQIDQKKQHIFAEKKAADLEELAIAELKDQEVATRKHLDNATHQKEFKALEMQVNTLFTKRNTQEELLLRRLFTLESTQSEYAKQKELAEKTIASSKQEQATLQANIQQLEQEKINVGEQIIAASANIKPDILAQYHRMKDKVIDPIVPVINNCCSACYNSVLRQDMAIIKTQTLVPCRSCYRFLYEQEQQPSAPLA